MIIRSLIALGLAALLHSPAHANPTPNPNTCIAGAPNGSTLTVYDQANTSSAVLGGIGVGQCGLFVTNQCEPGWCVIVFQGLNGWVQMQYVSGSDVQPPPGPSGSASAGSGDGNATQRFEITGGSGSVTFMGQRQPNPVDPGGVIEFTVLDDASARIVFPVEMAPGTQILTREQGNVWVGGFNDWVGIPTNGRIELVGVATPTPVLTLSGNAPMANFEIIMNLRPLSGGGGAFISPRPSPPTPAPRPAPPRPAPLPTPAQPAACDELDAIEQRILPFSGPEEVQAIRAIGIVNEVIGLAANRTEANCRAAIDDMLANPQLQDVLLQAGVIQAPSAALGPIKNDSLFCDELEAIVIAIEQSGDGWLQGLLNQIQDEARVDDIFAATAVQCEEMLRLLAQEGIDSPARVRDVAQQSNQPIRPTPPSNQQVGGACREVKVIVQAVDAVNHPRVTEVFDSSVQSVPIADLSRATEAQCMALMRLLEMEGLGTIQAVRELAASFRQETQISPVPTPQQNANACQTLSQSIRPILRGPNPDTRSRVLAILRANGVVDVFQAQTSVCAVIITELVTANIIVLPTPTPPAVVVVPGPLRPDPSDFIPEPAPSPEPVAPAPPAKNTCLELGDLMVAVLDRGNSRELINLADLLANNGIDRLTGKTQVECSQALIAAQRAGIQP